MKAKAITVRVTFTDDGGNDETLTSEARTRLQATKSADQRGRCRLVGDHDGRMGLPRLRVLFDRRQEGRVALSASFEVDGTTYTVEMVETQGWMYIGTDRELPFDFALELDGAEVRFRRCVLQLLQLRQHLYLEKSRPKLEGWRYH